jgi:hypothetical protein
MAPISLSMLGESLTMRQPTQVITEDNFIEISDNTESYEVY